MQTLSPSGDKGVFSRLGEGGNRLENTQRRAIKRAATSTIPDRPIAVSDSSPYVGVLKDNGRYSQSPKRSKTGWSDSYR